MKHGKCNLKNDAEQVFEVKRCLGCYKFHKNVKLRVRTFSIITEIMDKKIICFNAADEKIKRQNK